MALCFSMTGAPLFGITLEDLRSDPHLTPSRFARYFSNFKFQLFAEVQRPEAFLATESGDCDDYATLAVNILREKGYTTKLVLVGMPEVTHAVCYIAETHSYLDYNNRGFLVRTVSSDGSLANIARKVSRSFDSDWLRVREYSRQPGVPNILQQDMLLNPSARTKPIIMVARSSS